MFLLPEKTACDEHHGSEKTALYVRQSVRHVGQKAANELDTLDKAGYSVGKFRYPFAFFLILHYRRREPRGKCLPG